MKVELIKWIDTFGCPLGWEFEDEFETKTTKVRSVGFVLKETEEFIVLVPHISGSERRQLAGHISIPRQQIISRTIIFSSAVSCQELALKPNQQGF
ncbi:MAG: hypothetical protein NC112_09680 [Oxalobacter formigenes]|nr:hypothetical protein [Oxalobacter formigenes]